ncbi:hypothetical protein TRVL_10377 [Trypanosoma vivax]|nr:hypothetical protein TRVL_10377 [Trypanosoma vivax]
MRFFGLLCLTIRVTLLSRVLSRTKTLLEALYIDAFIVTMSSFPSCTFPSVTKTSVSTSPCSMKFRTPSQNPYNYIPHAQKTFIRVWLLRVSLRTFFAKLNDIFSWVFLSSVFTLPVPFHNRNLNPSSQTPP